MPQFSTAEARELWEKADQQRVQRDREEALATLSRLLDKEPQNPHVHNRVGVVLAEMGRLAQAEDSFCAALGYDPRHAPAISNIGNIRYEQGRYQEAIAKYNEALAVDPNYSITYNNLAAAQRRLGQYPASIRSLKRSHGLKRREWDRQSRDAAQPGLRRLRNAWAWFLFAAIGVAVVLFLMSR